MFAGSNGRALFLDYLTGNSGWADKRRQDMLAQADHYRRYGGLGLDPNLNYTVEIAPPEVYARAEQVLTDTLRSYVDEWLDSGRTPDGQEEPQERKLIPGTSARLAADGYLARHPIRSSMSEGKGIGAVFAEEAPPRTGADDPIAQAKEEATRLLAHFMTCNARWQLAKCFVCQEYFYPERKLRDFYKRGAYCEACRPKVSMLDTKKSRQEWADKILKLAAEAWPKWKPAHGPRQHWIAMRVNEKLSPGDKRIKGTWVTRNDEKIIERVKRNA